MQGIRTLLAAASPLYKNDFVTIVDEAEVELEVTGTADLFVVEVPYPAPYETFAQSRR